MNGEMKVDMSVVNDMKQMYESGYAIRNIEKKYGRSYGWVRRRLVAAGCEMPGGRRQDYIDPAIVDRMVKEYKSGTPVEDIVKLTGYCQVVVRKRCAAAGCIMRVRGGGEPIDMREAHALKLIYESGKSVSYLEEYTGRKNGWITARLTAASCSMRKKGFDKGKGNIKWRDGLSHKYMYPKEWTPKLRKKVRREQGGRCGDCTTKKHRRKMDVHHIDEDKQNCERSNLIALCHRCHGIRHGFRKAAK